MLVSLLVPLQKLTFATYGSSYDGQSSMLRNLYYVLIQSSDYEADMANLANSQQLITKFETWKSKVLNPASSSDFAPHEMSCLFRVVGFALDADLTDSANLKKWFQQLAQDMQTALESDNPINALLHGTALGVSGADTTDLVIRPLRDQVKELIALPRLQSAGIAIKSEISNVQTSAQLLAFESLITSIGNMTQQGSGSLSTSLGNLTAIFNSFSKIVALSPNPTGQNIFETISPILQKIATKDWVSLAQMVIDDLQTNKNIAGNPFDGRVLTFMRTLMEMYQSTSPTDAKNIFLANIENISSRQSRFNDFTIDATGLLAVRYGNEYVAGTYSNNLAGLYAPVGLQLAFHIHSIKMLFVDSKPWISTPDVPLGLLIYPIDVGAYLSNSDSSGTQVSDAIRLGGAIYFRLWNDVPLDLGVGADIKPATPSSSEDERIFAHLSMELPLFIFY
jgi:hypothetical protein